MLVLHGTYCAAIDPGKKGAMAFCDYKGRVWVEEMPEEAKDQCDMLRDWRDLAGAEGCGVTAILEKVGEYFPKSKAAASSVVKLARHNGELFGFLTGLTIPFREVRPAVWMRKVVPDLPSGYKGGVSQARKNLIKEQVQSAFPHIRVTLQTADALGLLLYLLRGG